MEALNKYQALIGLEVHTQLNTQSKIWCGCKVNVHSEENLNVCEICSGQPGTLPSLNGKIIELASKLALATNCKINMSSGFDRKNYFYPDMPKSYQITQSNIAFAVDGEIDLYNEDGSGKKIKIEKIQIEEDSGKLSHFNQYSLLNLNRSGVPLLEIVSAPELSTPSEATQYLKSIYGIINYLELSNGNLHDGNFRCDVNISLSEKGLQKIGVKTEIKNLNSFKNIERAIELEIIRQAAVLERGEKVQQVTLQFDSENNKINILRKKINKEAYRFLPEPDLNLLQLNEVELEEWKKDLPELPNQKIQRFVKTFNIPKYDATVLTSEKSLSSYFENAVSGFKGEPKKISNWIMVELLNLLNEKKINANQSPVEAKELAKLLNQVQDGIISSKQAKEVFGKMFYEKKTVSSIISESNLEQLSDPDELETLAQMILERFPIQKLQYHDGKIRMFDFFIGQIMKETKGRANPILTNEIMKKILDKNR